MNARTISRRIRPVWHSSQNISLRTPLQRRMASSNQQQPSPVGDFYKTFTRPVTKVLLMAMFTYQLAYWGWVKLEQDEIKAEREEEINSLEQKVSSLTEALKSCKPDDAIVAGAQISNDEQKKSSSSWWRWW